MCVLRCFVYESWGEVAKVCENVKKRVCVFACPSYVSFKILGVCPHFCFCVRLCLCVFAFWADDFGLILRENRKSTDTKNWWNLFEVVGNRKTWEKMKLLTRSLGGLTRILHKLFETKTNPKSMKSLNGPRFWPYFFETLDMFWKFKRWSAKFESMPFPC